MHNETDFGRFKRRIAPFITWEPLPITRPGKKRHFTDRAFPGD
jgi:hypothetical protein